MSLIIPNYYLFYIIFYKITICDTIILANKSVTKYVCSRYDVK